MKKIFKLPLFLPLTALLAACPACSMYDRGTRGFMDYPELAEDHSAIVDTAVLSEEERLQRLDELKALANQPLPAYTLDAGDMLTIKVYNHPDLEALTPVTPDGYIGMMFVGQVHVAGLTLPEACRELEKPLSEYIKNPIVGITPAEIKSQKATISGAVKQPGMYDISNGMRISDLFAKAGGSSTRFFDGQVLDAADFQNSLFIRGDRILPVDFSAAIEDGDYWNNIKLQKGDYVYIAVRSESMVTLLGEVNLQRQWIWNKTMGLLELLSAGGGLKDTYWQYAIIIRGGIINPAFYRVDLNAILEGTKPNVMLQPGDIVYIPRDALSEYNVFIRKLIPTAQLANLIVTPATVYTKFP